MRILKYAFLFVLLCIPSISYGASSAAWNFYDPELGIRPDTEVVIRHQEIATTPFNIEGFVSIYPDHEDFNAATGELYFIDGATGTRELVVYIEDGGTPVTWTREGVYELDVYGFVEAPMRGPKSPFEHFAVWFFGETAHAAFGTYVDTIRFTVEEAPPPAPPCCSSVLFLPGIKGSVLKTGNDTLWPADAFGGDIPQLTLTETGESINDVVVSGLLDTYSIGLFSVPVYRDFSIFMDSLTEDEGNGIIHDWVPYAYDWRYSLNKTLEEGAVWEDEGENVFLGDVVENLASESKTGKVSIVAHSMGGLLGKLLIQKLEEEGRADLIDNFIMVGTPQLGTPQGMASLLHGDDEGLLQGILVDPRNVRAVAQNMQSVHDLLPSTKYFDQVSDPVLVFNENASFTNEWRNYWGNCVPGVACINSYNSFKEFITGQGVSRSSPPTGQLQTPEVLRENLVLNSKTLHENLDTYEFPSHIRVVQIAGWGRPPVKSIEYKNVHGLPGYETDFTSEGDKTVVYSSSLASEAEAYYLDLVEYEQLPNTSLYGHSNILSAEIIQTQIESILNGDQISTTGYFSLTKPNTSSINKLLAVYTRSPVALYAEDESGNITGVHPSQNLSSEVLFIAEQIPGSSFLSYGGDQYLFLPEQGNYSFKVKGTGTGPATIEVGSFENDTVTLHATYTDIPVTENTEIIFSVDQSTPENTVLQTDLEGAGTFTELYPDNYEPPEELTINEMIALLRTKIEALDAKDKLKKKLLKRLDKLEQFLEKNKKKQKILNRMKAVIERKVHKGKIQEETGEELIKLLEDIENAIY